MIIEEDPPIPHQQKIWEEHYDKTCPLNGVSLHGRANTGVYLLRNSEIGKKMIQEWVAANDKYYRLQGSWMEGRDKDQKPFNCDVISHPEYSKHILLSTNLGRWHITRYEAGVKGMPLEYPVLG